MSYSELQSRCEAETQNFGAELARVAFKAQPAFVRLSGQLGAGKSTFARGFINEWLTLCGEPKPDNIVSPTYNIVKMYGTKAPLAHLDLYRLNSLRELEQLGFEHYFYEQACCLIEWLEQIPEAVGHMPANAIQVELAQGRDEKTRTIRVRSSTKTS